MPPSKTARGPASKLNSDTKYDQSKTTSRKKTAVVELTLDGKNSAALNRKNSVKSNNIAKKLPVSKPKAANIPAPRLPTKRKASDSDTENVQKKPKTAVFNRDSLKVSSSKRTNQKQSTKKPPAVKASIPKKYAKVEKVQVGKTKPQKKNTTSTKLNTSITSAPKKLVKSPQIINTPPSQRLDIYVFGEGSAGELGLGAKIIDRKSPVDVKRPRLNPFLSAKDVGVVQLAVGGMHCAALTHDNRILTWGVNDQGALGRELAPGGKMTDITEGKEIDSDSDDNEDSGLNPNEAEPREIDKSAIEPNTKFAGVFAGDSTTFALTTDGRVYGWGTFRGNDGVLGFRHDIKTQFKPMLIPELKNIVNISCGTNHVLALDIKGKVFTWGAGEQNQLARRVVSRTAAGALIPREFGLGRKKIIQIGCGDYHSFAIDENENAFSWGLNTFGQTGIPKEGLNEEDKNTIQLPSTVDLLKDYKIKQIIGGAHHTLACTEIGEILIWGRIDNHQGGMKIEDMPQENIFFDEDNRPRYLKKPTRIPNLKGSMVATGNDTCIVVDTEGKAYSWGFSSNYQTGQGIDEDIIEATCIENTAVRGQKLIFAGVGGQFGVLGGIPAQDQSKDASGPNSIKQ